ncbi:uncharacterized protein LOC129943158 isoform X4 [Eupeodes corollae]|uniref:uncharacterized protein LOC129943158 isoform X4 n=1 Tax=Eupeodes corollae TaxID=290404 RepID=UPI0024916F1A|nr:uncharacterized protein LOC129943158 isoform X4 [Eupeodes corollae]
MLVLINLVLYTSTLRAFANVYSQLRFTFNDSVVKKHILLGYFSRMASPPESPIEDIVYELEPTRMPKECPEGVVHEECFKDIYAKFFPHGSKFYKF